MAHTVVSGEGSQDSRGGLRGALLIVLLAAAWATCASGGAERLTGEPEGQIRLGASLLCGDDQGRLHLFVGDEHVVAGMGIACGLGGHTTSAGFEEKRTERGAGIIEFSGALPGHDVRFEQRVSAVGDRVRIELLRTGAWPEEGGWCSFQFSLPFARHAGAEYRADGQARVFPVDTPPDFSLASGAKKLECSLGDPGLNLKLECATGISLQDERRWGGAGFQVGVDFPAGNPSKTELFLTLPDSGRARPGPRLCYSQIGYPGSGLKFVVLEWPKGTERPSDWVRLEDVSGGVAEEGRFGDTVEYDYMQNSFAVFDFSRVREPGDYRVVWSGGSQEVQIRWSVFEDRLWEPTLDFLIPWQMCHAELDFGGRLPRQPRCHMDDGVRVPADFPGVDGFRSYGCEGTPYAAGEAVPCARGGWHDAGDYDLNVHAQGFSTWMLALAYEEFGIERDVATLDAERQVFLAGRPDGVPDIVQQVEWGADWLLSMEQPDGRVYVGVVEEPERYTASILPEEVTDGLAGTGDERHVYVDYHPEVQLIQAISLAAASRALAKARPELARRCVDAARRAFEYFQTHEEVYRDTSYFQADPRDKGRDGMVAAAAIELYLTTDDGEYLRVVERMSDALGSLVMEWPSPYSTREYGFWYSPPFLARLHPRLGEGELKSQVEGACRRAAELQARLASPRPWPFYEWHFGQWGNNGHCVDRAFDAYWLSRVAPDALTMEDALRAMLWIFGLHPVNDVVFVCDIGYPGPKHLYSGRLHGRYGTGPAGVPGAVVPGMGSLPGAGMVVYRDEHGNYGHNEACIYTQARYIFAVNALKKAGY